MLKKFDLFLIIILCLLIIVSKLTSGFQINNSVYSINKTFNTPTSFKISFVNNESFSFYNISFEDNPYVSMNKITELPANIEVVVNVTSNYNSNSNINVKLKGYYLTNVGAQLRTYYVNVTSNEPFLSFCNKNLIAGDTVIWKNTLLDPIMMYDANSGNSIEGASILSNNSLTKTFSNPTSFYYNFKRSSFTFTPSCMLSILPTNGYINNPSYDSILTFNIRNDYQPTNITTNIVLDNYTMSFDKTQDGVMTISNTGSLIAYNVHLSGEWILFNANNFDLSPGQTKGVVYTIVPIVTNTNDTNKQYAKKITISGNFPTQEKSLNIFINQANINSNSSSDADYLINIFCPKFPNSTLCNPEPRVEYRYISNSSDKMGSFNMSQQQLNDLWLYMFKQGDEFKTATNEMKAMIYDVMNKNNLSTSDLATLKQQALIDSEARDKQVTNTWVVMGVGITLIVCTLSGFLIYQMRLKKKLEVVRRF